MSVSGNQETGVYARHSSISSAGVPIKKRRFPMFRPNSPPQEEPSSLPEEILSSLPTQKDSGVLRQSSPSQDSSRLNASVVTSSAVKSDASKNGILEVKKESSSETTSSSVTSVQESLKLSKAILPELNVAFDSSLPDNVDSKAKVIMLTGKSAKENVQLQPELHLTPTGAPAVRLGKEAVSKHDLGTDFKLGLSSISEGSVLSLGPKEPTALAGQTSDGSHRVPEKLNPSALSLSFSKEKCLGLLENHHTSRKEDALVHSNRSNWDLNTTMDAWEGSVGEAAIPRTVLFTGLNEIGGTHDIKSSLSTLEAGDVRGKRIVEAGDQISRLPISSSSNQQYRSEDSLRLSLSTSFSQPNVRVENSGLSTKTDSSNVLPNSNVHGVFGSTENKNVVTHPIVKSEPRDDSVKNDHVGAGANLAKPNHVADRSNPARPNHVGDRSNTSKPDYVENRASLAKPDHVGDRGNPAKPIHMGDRGNPAGLLDTSTVKMEMVERCNRGTDKLPTISSHVVVEPKRIKSEPVQEGNREAHGKQQPMSLKLTGQNVHHQDNSSSITVMHSQAQNSCVSGELVMQADVSVSGEAPIVEHATFSAHKENQLNTDIRQEGSGNVSQAPVEMVSTLNQENKESNADDGTSNASMVENTLVDGTSNASMVENTLVDGPDTCAMIVRDEAPQCSRVHGEAGSEDEKVSISNDMLEEDSYGSDTESDGNKAVLAPSDTQQRKNGKEEDDLEDGEVRDPLVQAAAAAAEGSSGEEARNITLAGCSNEDSKSISFRGDDSIVPAPIAVKDSKEEDRGEINDALLKDTTDAFLGLKPEHVIDEGSSLQESVTSEMLTVGPGGTRALNAVCAADECARSGLEMDCDMDTYSDGANNEGQGSEMTVVQAADENIKGTDAMDGNDSTLPNTEAHVDVNDTVKDSNTGVNRSRIINLPRATNATSPYRRSFPERSYGRERYADFDGERMHPRRNRDDDYTDGPRKFLRDRYQGQSFRNPRQSYGRGRGRGYGRTDSSRNEWDSDRIFIPRSYNGQTDFRFNRHKRNSAVGDEEHECNGFMAPDGDLVGSGRGGRKPVDELPSFRHPSSRRLSPGARDGPANRGIQMLRRIPRNISPSRCAGEDGSELVGLRHGDKFIRDDIIDPIFSRNQPPFEGLDRQFGRGGRNFPPGQRRGGPRVRSKSPIRSRTRSPGPWSSPRRRSPDGFNGVSEFNQHRSPVMYRKERIRSPNLPCSPDGIADRRRGSPSYMTRPSNDARDMDSGRAHGHQRSVIPNRRSSPDRVIPRNNRRFDVLEPRERTDSDEYFGGPPLRSGRFHELGGDGNGDDRRKFGERRAIIRPPFRASGGGADNENFRCHPDDGPPPRSFRLSPEADSDMFERINARERDFDRRVKNNRPVIQPRRIEQQEGNYRQQGGGQVWHDEGFDDSSRTKRRRF